MPSSVLSDGTIRRLVDDGRIRIDPWEPGMVQPASVDLRLGASFRVFHNHRVSAIDLAAPPENLTELVQVAEDEPFVIHPQEFCLGRTHEWVELPDDLVARIEGKALALDTEIPTPDGWTTMGEIGAGDWVFDPSGAPVRVAAVTGPLEGRPCRAVVFDDGTRVAADVHHEWEVRSAADARRGAPFRVLSTAELEARPDEGWQVATTGAVRYRDRELPVDPYRLGREPGAADDAGGCDGGVATLPRATAAVLADCLTAGVEQRRALLHGLMDAAGDVDADGRCRLRVPDPATAAACRELVAGLGLPPATARASEVVFSAAEPVFRDARRRARQQALAPFAAPRAIVAIDPVASVPVRCLEVRSARGAFLVTRSFLPTHNSSLGRLGLIVHATAGFVDPGFKGTLTLEITNLTRVPIVLWPGKPIAQLSFMTLDRAAERPYGHPDLGSHYHGQLDATESRYEGGPAAR